MTQEIIISFLQSNKTALKEGFGVKRIGLFGSYAKGKAKPSSDIDFLVEFENPTYDSWYGLKKMLESALNAHVDLTTIGKHLSARFYENINSHIIYI